MSENTGGCACGGSCGCGGHSHDASEEVVYLTRDQYIARLEQYLVELKAEISAVEAELTELRQAA